MVELLVAAAVAPWAHPLAFKPLAGWHTRASGNVPSLYGPSPLRAPKESSAWLATKNVRYRDEPTADPPNKTLTNLPRAGVIVWAAIFQGQMREQKPIRLDLDRARRFDCCEGPYVAGGMYELTGYGPRRSYTVYVRVYFGSRPTVARRAAAQRALDHLALPAARS